MPRMPNQLNWFKYSAGLVTMETRLFLKLVKYHHRTFVNYIKIAFCTKKKGRPGLFGRQQLQYLENSNQDLFHKYHLF